NPIALAIGGDARAVIPGTVGISKEVVAGLGRSIHAGQIEPPWSIFTEDGGHPSRLLGAGDGLQSGHQDHDPCNRARYFTHAYLLSLCSRRRAISLMTALLSRSASPARTQASSTSQCTLSMGRTCPWRLAWSSIRCTSLSVCRTRPSGVKSP